MSASDNAAEPAVTCHFCGAQKPLDLAIDEGWCPSFWDGDREIGEPACPVCQSQHLDFNEEYGDFEKKVLPCIVTR
jgi:hypothetical protein